MVMDSLKRHDSYHIVNRTDLRVFKKEAEERQKKDGQETLIHLHAMSIDCGNQEHINYTADGKVIGPW
jgi:hypothetical protein